MFPTMEPQRNRLAHGPLGRNRTRVKSWRWLTGFGLALVAGGSSYAQTPEASFPRPGAVVVMDVTGQAFAGTDDQRRPLKPEDRLRVGSTITTAQKSLATIVLSNGAMLKLGSESELEVEEFGQTPVSGNIKFAELKEEPTASRTLLRLVKGDVVVDVKPLKMARGSTFMVSMLAGTIRCADGTFHAMVRMSDLGLGVCTLEVEKGTAEFELPGSSFAPVPSGRKLAFAIELDRVTGAPKISDMPKETPKAK